MKPAVGSQIRCLVLVAAVSLLIVLPVSAAGLSQGGEAEKVRVREQILQALVKDSEFVKDKGPEDIAWINKESIPILIEYSTDTSLPLAFREEAFVFLKAVPDARILQPFEIYLRDWLNHLDRPCEGFRRICEIFASYYNKTGDKRALSLFIEMLSSDVWPGAAKHDAVVMLGLCKSLSSREILKSLVINNSAYPYQYHKALAASALAEQGDESVLPNLIEYAGYILDDDLGKGDGRGLAAIEGVHGLSLLARTNDDANQALCELAQRFVSGAQYYVYRDRAFDVFGESVIPALAGVGRKENVRLIERMLTDCKHEPLIRQGIEVLGEIGDELTVKYLENFGGYRERTNKAIANIKTRLAKKA